MRQMMLFFFLAVLTCCNLKEQNTDLDKAVWIGNNKALPGSDSLFYLDDPAPLFRKEFRVGPEAVTKATLYISAAGYYRATINGNRIGDVYLDPAWTTYDKRIYYTEYDLTPDLVPGVNCLGVMLGNGFYNPLPMRMWGRRNLRNVLPVGRPVFISRIVICYENGKTREIVSDQTWKYTDGPVIKNNVYIGEVYDARFERKGWDSPGYDAEGWSDAVQSDGPGGMLQKAFFPPVKITGLKKPAGITSAGEGVYLADMGENFAGLYRIRLRGEIGDTVIFRFGERTYQDGSLNPMTTVSGQIKKAGVGGPGAPAIAWQTDAYIFGNENEIWYTPEFTFHTYRYMEIRGLKYEPSLSDIQGLALNSAVEQSHSFECSSCLLNSIQEISTRTFLSNLVSVQSDCPARERFGYGGDINAVSEAYIYNFDMQSFYRKTIYDWLDAMNDSSFIDTAPFVGIQYCGISWESAYLLLQYQLLLFYNDTSLIRELYDYNLDWMDKVKKIHPEGIVEAGLADHEALVPVPVELTGTCHYLQAARIMERFAGIVNDVENEKRFHDLAKELSDKIAGMFWTNQYETKYRKINKQTLFATLIYHDILPENMREAAADSLIAALEAGPAGHFSTGIFGTKYILEALSENGLTSSVFDVVNSTAYPGWGFMIENGATTLWETWKESDDIFSNCHPMFGSVSEWFFRWLGGIRPDPENPGFKKFFLNPEVVEDLSFVKCSYKSPLGIIKSGWEKMAGNIIRYHFTIPEDAKGMVKIHTGKHKLPEVTMNSISVELDGDNFEGNYLKTELGPGEYIIEVWHPEQ